MFPRFFASDGRGLEDGAFSSVWPLERYSVYYFVVYLVLKEQ